MKNPRIRTRPRYLAYKMFGGKPASRFSRSLFWIPRYRFRSIEGEETTRRRRRSRIKRGWEKKEWFRKMAEGWNGRRGRESFPSRLLALTIVRIARYRSSPRFIVGEIYVKCIEGLGHFYSIEIMSTSQLLCSPAQTILSRTASYRELSNNSPPPPLPPIFSSSFSHIGDFRAKEELDARPMSRFVVPGTPPSPHDNCFVETSSFFSRPPLPFSSPIN